MLKSALHQARFFDTVAHAHQLPNEGLPEIAFVGRSNAGKSSGLNVLSQQKQLAFVSKMPGRTQHLNFFAIPDASSPKNYVKAEDEIRGGKFAIPQKPPLGFLVDLPGYGFARVGHGMKSHWSQYLTGYVQSRHPLAGVVWLMDIRHALTEIDLQFFPLLSGREVMILLTKADKITRNEQINTTRRVQNALRELQAKALNIDIALVQPCLTVAFSSTHRIGLEAATRKIESWLGLELPVIATTAATSTTSAAATLTDSAVSA